ncbi:hypothetical protein [Flaviaesturariibacter aridisoli]|uniref:Uncharacterized protein n=1 Tax=Flaviaesturariibacter aridisoli TaxID=2545761 RepID=A0A4R4DQV9_9BACT|nr:hypothetical protein [Flaviaesturariibacter aridisoli]TCZ64583.1 hypothetical protein E0486_18170 [Flaviaesturariibacter aridisoli]
MKYCVSQCRSNFHNDKRHLENQVRYNSDPVRRRCDQILEALFLRQDTFPQVITKEVLQALGLDSRCGTLEKNLETGLPVVWFYRFGLEQTVKGKNEFTIHYRTQTPTYD